MMRALSFLLLLPLPLLGSGCNVLCDRAGCDAMDDPITDAKIQTGIAGHVASQSDSSTNGCAECPLSQTTITIRTAEAPVTTIEEARALRNGQTAEEIPVDQRYERKLDPGDYLVCYEDMAVTECAALTVADGQVFTVNVAVGNGAVELTVFAPGSSTPRTEGLYRL